MTHPFQDKLFVFIGTPIRCTRREARDALMTVGGIPDERITEFTSYVVTCKRAEGTKVYRLALEYERDGLLSILNEEQFFNILEGKAEPPEKPKRDNNIIVIPGKDPEAEARESEQAWNDILNRKRMNNIAKYGVPMPDGGRAKIDLRPLDMARRVADLMKEKSGQTDKTNMPNRCDDCWKPAMVHIGDGEGGEMAKLCFDCHNKLMSELTETDMPGVIPKRLSFGNNDGEVREFEIEFRIYQNGKTLTATEVGETKLKVDVHGELDEDFDEMMETLTSRIEKMLSVKYMEPNGYFIESKAVGYVEYNHERDACDIIIDGKAYTWAELEKNISAHEGWKIKIEFGDVGDELD